MNLKNNSKDEISADTKIMDTRVKLEYDEQRDSFLGNGPRMTNREASSLCITQENTSHLSSSDLIGGSIKDESDINNEVNINMVDTRVCALLCPRMTNGRMDTRGKPEYDKKKISSLYQKEENTSHLSSSNLIQENLSPSSSSNLPHLSSSDLIGGSIKDKGGINNLSQINKGYIHSNNLLQPKERNSNNSSQRKGYTMNLNILPQQNDLNTNPNNLLQLKEHNSNNSSQRKGYTMNPTILPQQKEYNSLSNNLSQHKGYTMNLNILPQQNDFNTNPNNLLQLKEHDLPKKKGCNMKQNYEMGQIPSLSSSCVTRGSIGQQCHLSQSGRSMVEMLGTLAIIGVLSVGGIMGYSYGMDKWRASATLNDVNLRMIDLVTQVLQGRNDIALSNEWATTGQAGYPIGLFPNIDNEPSIIVEQVPSSVCKLLLSGSSDTQDIFVGLKSADQIDGNWYSGSNEDICAGGNKDMLFALNEEVLANLPNNDSDSEDDTTTECKTNADCHTDKPFCEGGKCKACAADEHCPSELKYCDTAKGVCHECISNDDCGAGQFCADTNESSTKANPYTCKNLSFSTIDLTNEEGVTETWHYSNEPITWWDTKMACDAMDLRMPTFLELSTGERSSTTLMGYYVVRPHIYTLFNLTSAYSANPWSSFLTVDTPP